MPSKQLWWIGGVVAVALLLGGLAWLGYARQRQIYVAGTPVDLDRPTDRPPDTPAPAATSPAAAVQPTAEARPTDIPPTQGATAEPTRAPTSTTRATPAPELATPTTQSTVTPTATPQPFVPQPEVALHFDDFASPDSGWDPLYVDAAANVNGYSAGAYTFDITRPAHLLYDIHPAVFAGGGRYAAAVRYDYGIGAFGLLLDVAGDPAQPESLSFYQVRIGADGGVAVVEQRGAAGRTLAETPPGAVRIQPGATVALEAITAAAQLRIVVDGAELLRVPNVATRGGALGLFAESADAPLRVAFDDLLAVATDAEAPRACDAVRTLAADAALSGDDVATLQRRLSELGYSVGTTGQYDGATAAVVAQFQQANRLAADGVAGADTWCRLLSGAAVTAAGQQERALAAELAQSPSVDGDVGISTPLMVSVRQPDTSWRIALALPNRPYLHYLETGGDAYDPAWSPDQRYLAFTSERGGRSGIWLLALDTGQITPIRAGELVAQFPTWAPDSSTLYFTGEPGLNQPLAARDYFYNVDSQQLSMLDDEHAGWGDWSSQNELIVTRYSGSGFDLFRINPVDGSAVNLTNTPNVNEDIPAWSPDGTQIAFVANPRNQEQARQIMVMNRDGSGVRQVSSLAAPNSNPVWAPDGRTLAFANRNASDVWQPWLVDVDGGQIRRLADNHDRIWFMEWVRPE